MPGRAPDELCTARLRLRRWRRGDRVALAALNADPDVMRHVASGPLPRAASDALVERIEAEWEARGRGTWAVEPREGGPLLGFCGLATPGLPVPDRGAGRPLEIGWRLRRDAWGHGYATEAARAVVAVAGSIGVPELVALVHPANDRSLALAERLGMRVCGQVTQRLRRGPTWRLLDLRLVPPAGGAASGRLP